MPLQIVPKKDSEPLEALRDFRGFLEKRSRNLEKKKGKLEVYKSKFDKGEKLNEDQTKAVERLDGVQKQIEIVVELQSHITTVLDQCEKSGKKREKRDRYERERQDINTIARISEIQTMLQEIEESRDCFVNGQHGAVTLTERELEYLDELYKKINPTRAVGENSVAFEERCKQTGEFIVNLLDGRDRPSTIGMSDSGENEVTEDGNASTITYKDLKELVDKVLGCDFFTGPKIAVEETEQDLENVDKDVGDVTDGAPIETEARSVNLVNGGSTVASESGIAVTETFPEVNEEEEVGTNGNEVVDDDESPPAQSRPHASWSEVAAADGDKKNPAAVSDMINHLSSNYTFLVESRLDATTPTNTTAVVTSELLDSPVQSQVASKTMPAASAPIPVPAKKCNWADDADINASGSWADEPLPSFDAHSPAAAPSQTESRSHMPEGDVFASASQSDYLQSGGDDGEDGGGSWQQQHPRSSGHRGSGGRGGFRRERGSGGPRNFRGSRGGYRGRGGNNWNSERGGNERSWGGRGGGSGGSGYRGGNSSGGAGGGAGPYRGSGGNYRGYRSNFEYTATGSNSFQ